jgi:hypothetical protein|tara:strand:+ start:145 stop:288 length:144 start_codon:yes stop_codon:yes gene_type:complete
LIQIKDGQLNKSKAAVGSEEIPKPIKRFKENSNKETHKMHLQKNKKD